MAAHPGRRPGSPALRRLTAVVLVAAPAVLLLGAPATAAPAVAVTPLAATCGLAVDVSGLDEGPHVLVVRTTVLATGADVPVVEDEAGGEAVSDPARDEAGPDEAVEADPAAEEPAAEEPVEEEPVEEEPVEEPLLEAVLTVDGGAEGEDVVLEVVLDASAVPEDERWVRVALELDGAVLPGADVQLATCDDPEDPSPSPTPSGSPSPSPSGSASPSGTPTSSATPSGSPSGDPSATAGPSATVTPTTAVTPTPSPSPPPSPTTSASPSATRVAASDPLLPDPLAGSVQAAVDVRAPLGTGTSGYRLLARSTWTTRPTATARVVAPVPDPVVAPLDGVPAGALVAIGPDPSPLAGLLPRLPARGEPAQRRALASPTDLRVSAAGDPLVDLAPAGFVLAASFGGLLVAGRRRGT